MKINTDGDQQMNEDTD
jgi:hypothetical protein